ncbi:MAG: hypoxanthine phosphoribosyltransferase [Alphaproteobacteria bacterium]|nr:hypoxanthine phosphoribosyltransferase [Alphaproteobacteria bacterium]
MRTLFTERQIAARIDELAADIAASLAGSDRPIAAPILTGALFFAADLIRAMHARGCDALVDCVQLGSYGGARTSSGVVQLLKDFSVDVQGRDVLLIDDVLDTGRSLHFGREMLLARGVNRALTCVLVRKATGRAEDLSPDFVGFEAGAEDFLVGYGMDDAGLGRGLPFIGAVDPVADIAPNKSNSSGDR